MLTGVEWVTGWIPLRLLRLLEHLGCSKYNDYTIYRDTETEQFPYAFFNKQSEVVSAATAKSNYTKNQLCLESSH